MMEGFYHVMLQDDATLGLGLLSHNTTPNEREAMDTIHRIITLTSL